MRRPAPPRPTGNPSRIRTQSGRQLLVQRPGKDGTFTMDGDAEEGVDTRGPTAVGQDAAPLPPEDERPAWLQGTVEQSLPEGEAIMLDDDDFSVEHDEQSAAGIAPLPPGDDVESSQAAITDGGGDPETTLPDVGSLFPEGVRPIIPPPTTLTQGPVVIGESDVDIAESRVENTQPTGIPNPLLEDWSAQAEVGPAQATAETQTEAAESPEGGAPSAPGLPEARSTADYPLGFHIPDEDSPEARAIAEESKRRVADARRTVETPAVPIEAIALTSGALDAFADDEDAPSTLEAPVPEWVLKAAAGDDSSGPWGGLGAELAAADLASGVEPVVASASDGAGDDLERTAPDPNGPEMTAPDPGAALGTAPVDPFAPLQAGDPVDAEGLRATLQDSASTTGQPAGDSGDGGPGHFWWSPESSEGASEPDGGHITGATADSSPEKPVVAAGGYVRGRTAAWPALVPPKSLQESGPHALGPVGNDGPTHEDASVPAAVLAASVDESAAAPPTPQADEAVEAPTPGSSLEPSAEASTPEESTPPAESTDDAKESAAKEALATAAAAAEREPNTPGAFTSEPSGAGKLGAIVLLVLLLAVAVVGGLFASGFFDQERPKRPAVATAPDAADSTSKTTKTVAGPTRALPTVRKAGVVVEDVAGPSDAASQAEASASADAGNGPSTDASKAVAAADNVGDVVDNDVVGQDAAATHDTAEATDVEDDAPPVVRLDAVSDAPEVLGTADAVSADVPPKSKAQLAKEARQAALEAKKAAKLKAAADKKAAAAAKKQAKLDAIAAKKKAAADKLAAKKKAAADKLAAKKKAAADKLAAKAKTAEEKLAAKKKTAADRLAAAKAKKQARLDAIAAKKNAKAEKKAARIAALKAKKQARLDAIAAKKKAAADKKAARIAALKAKKQAKLDAIAAKKKAAADKKAQAAAAKAKAAADKRAARLAKLKAAKDAKATNAKLTPAQRKAARAEALRAKKAARLAAAEAKKKAAADKKAARIAALKAKKQAKLDAVAAKKKAAADKKAARIAALKAKKQAKLDAVAAKKKAAADKKAARIAATKAKKQAKLDAVAAKKKAAADKKAARIAAAKAKKQGENVPPTAAPTVKKVTGDQELPELPANAPSAAAIAPIEFGDVSPSNPGLVAAKELLEGRADVRGAIAWYLRTWAFNKDWATAVAKPMPIKFQSCGRKKSAWSSRKGVNVCYELIATFAESFPNYFKGEALDDAVAGAALWVVLHNVAHETARRLDVPRSKPSEKDVERVLAALLIQRPEDPAVARLIPLVQRGLQAMIRVSAGKYRDSLLKAQAWRNHALTSGRLRSTMCALYGVAPQPWLITRFDLKEQRAKGCAKEAAEVRAKVGKKLLPYLRVR